MNIVHVVRDFGGLTEPFITDRVLATSDRMLWAERLSGPLPDGLPLARIDVRFIRAGSVGDRLFFHLPQLGPPLARSYAIQETRDRPDVIHAHYLSTGCLIASRTRAPMVVSTYGFDVAILPKRRWWRSSIRTLAARARRFLVEGPAMAARLQGAGIESDRVSIVPISVDLRSAPFRPPRTKRSDARLIVCGRLIEKKGIDLAIKAMASLTCRPGLHLDIVGDGRLRPQLEASVRTLGLGEQVTFRGSLPRAAYLGLLRECDILLAPSRTAANGDSEGGAPTTILDAQASGVIVIGSTHADIPYLISDGQTGYLFEEGDATALASAVERCLSSGDEWPAMAKHAREQIERRHTTERLADKLEQVYAGVLG